MSESTTAGRAPDTDRLTPLPAPHSSVKISCRAMFWAFVITYTGHPDALIDVGAIEPHMLLGARTCGRGVDSHGYKYMRRTQKNCRQEIVRYIESTEVLLSLPGAQEAWIPAQKAPEPLTLAASLHAAAVPLNNLIQIACRFSPRLKEQILPCLGKIEGYMEWESERIAKRSATRPHLRLVVDNDVQS
jgi:hypothetical protein